MREPGEIAAVLPRPGRVLKTVLALVAAFALGGAIVVNWAPGGAKGVQLFNWLAFAPQDFLTRPWTFVTSGLLTNPLGIWHAVWSIVGLYFLAPDLEKRWGGARFVRFLLLSVICGNLAVLAGWFAPLPHPLFHPALVFGPLAAITAVVVAWSREHAHAQIRFFFFLPMSGRTLFWVTVALALLSLVFAQGAPEGAFGPIGGVAAGLLFGGTPSPARSVWLRIKLAFMRRGGRGATVESVLEPQRRTRGAKRGSGKGPALRVVPGGLEDELKNRKPPKDKRYLN